VAVFDRRNAPWSALAASFGAVLVIGLFTHGAPGPAGPAKASPSPKASATAAPRTGQASGSALTVHVTESGAAVPFADPTVTVSKNGQAAVSLGHPARHARGTGDYVWIKPNVPAGDYRVCVIPPARWMVTSAGCRQAGPGAQVLFDLAPSPASVPGAP
jgi:hypothetical protein